MSPSVDPYVTYPSVPVANPFDSLPNVAVAPKGTLSGGTWPPSPCQIPCDRPIAVRLSACWCEKRTLVNWIVMDRAALARTALAGCRWVGTAAEAGDAAIPKRAIAPVAAAAVNVARRRALVDRSIPSPSEHVRRRMVDCIRVSP